MSFQPLPRCWSLVGTGARTGSFIRLMLAMIRVRSAIRRAERSLNRNFISVGVSNQGAEVRPTGHVNAFPSFSVVICTNGRSASLAELMGSVEQLDYSPFEVCVVRGPGESGVADVLSSWRGRIKLADCPERNVSMSRNIGIALAAGEIVAFVDDDAIPETAWLRDLARAYESPETGGAGGFVYDESGVNFQHRFTTVDRLGEANPLRTSPAVDCNFPGSAWIPHLLGTNCSFRRDALLSIGGFDEEYEYYLDETDVCCRLIDQGWKLAQVEGACVRHKRLAGSVRDENGSIRIWYPILKNKIYYSFMNGSSHHRHSGIARQARLFATGFANTMEIDIAAGWRRKEDRGRFYAELELAWRDGMTRGLSGERRLINDATLEMHARRFLPFLAAKPASISPLR